MRFPVTILISLSLAACAETASEQQGIFVYSGRTYSAVTREFVRNDGSTYSRRSINYGGHFVSCSATDDLDCRAAIAEQRSRRDR